MPKNTFFVTAICYLVLTKVSAVYGFDTAEVLPKGVSRVMVSSLHTSLNSQFGPSGQNENLGSRLTQSVTFNDFLNLKSGPQAKELMAFMLTEGYQLEESLGTFKADVRAAINAMAPSYTYGFTDRLSIGFVVPVVEARTSLESQFERSPVAEEAISRLASPEVGQRQKAVEAAQALSNVENALNQKLSNLGYEKLSDTESRGLGDVFVRAKYLALTNSRFRLSTTLQIKSPTGKGDDPNVLTDIPLGNGAWEIGSGLQADLIPSTLLPGFINFFALITRPLDSTKQIRLATLEDPLNSQIDTVRVKLGDQVESGLSYQMELRSGLIFGLGETWRLKWRDRYKAGPSSTFYEARTQNKLVSHEAQLGYSSIKAFQRKQVPIPFATTLSFSRPWLGQNLPKSDLLQWEAKVFF